MKFKTFQEAMAAPRPIVAANDNEPRKPAQPRYRGTLPALRWLFDTHPGLAPAMATALPKPHTNWSAEVVDNGQKIRPTVGALMSAASDAFRVYVRDGKKHVGAGLVVKQDGGLERATLGTLKFLNGRLAEWARTKKGAKLRPIDQLQSADAGKSSHRDPRRYLETKATTPSPLQAEPLPRNVSDRPVLPPVKYAPLGFPASPSNLAQLFPGMVKVCTGDSGSTAWQDIVSERESRSEFFRWVEDLKPRDKAALEATKTAKTYADVGVAVGQSRDYADKKNGGRRALMAANDNLMGIIKKMSA